MPLPEFVRAKAEAAIAEYCGNKISQQYWNELRVSYELRRGIPTPGCVGRKRSSRCSRKSTEIRAASSGAEAWTLSSLETPPMAGNPFLALCPFVL